MKTVIPGHEQSQDKTGSMLQRWQQESMLDQPYNNIEAVKTRADHTNNSQVSQQNKKSFSLGYFDPRAKPE